MPFGGRQRRVVEALAVVVSVCLVPSARAERGGLQARSGRIAIIDQANPSLFGHPFGVATIDRTGVSHALFRCRVARGCYDLESIDWAADGRRLAFSVTTVGAVSSYNGIHILNVRTRKDRHLPWDGFDLDWSPDGTEMAYVESERFAAPFGSIYILRVDRFASLLARSLVPTGTTGLDASPSWSPDGRRLVYETRPSEKKNARRAIFVIDVNGAHRRLVATRAADPAWSPGGRTIAYSGGCGIKLVTPEGRDVTPRSGIRGCHAIGVAGRPVWSPDGRRIAISNRRGVYVIDSDGSHLRRLSGENPTGIFGFSRPTWQALVP